jgi:hypothetical protein
LVTDWAPRPPWPFPVCTGAAELAEAGAELAPPPLELLELLQPTAANAETARAATPR